MTSITSTADADKIDMRYDSTFLQQHIAIDKIDRHEAVSCDSTSLNQYLTVPS